MKVLVACEYSGRVREAFNRRGHDAISVDFLESQIPGSHHVGDVLEVIRSQKFDLMVAFPPCTHLAVSGARWFKEKQDGRQELALQFVRDLMEAPIESIAIENPVSIISSRIRKPDQIIQPYHYGDEFRKTTCLWLKNLPKLKPTNIVEPKLKTHKTKSGKTVTFSADYGWSTNPKRSTTYPGIADAMADQWGSNKKVFQMSLLEKGVT